MCVYMHIQRHDKKCVYVHNFAEDYKIINQIHYSSCFWGMKDKWDTGGKIQFLNIINNKLILMFFIC